MSILNDLIKNESVADPERLLARISFWAYCQYRHPKFYRDDRTYLRTLCDTLQALYERRLVNEKTGEIYRNIMISVPPRHGKSFTLTLFAEWVFGRNPANKVLTISYNDILATRFARRVRDDIDAETRTNKIKVFRDVFPGVRIKYGDASASLWSLEDQYDSYLASGFNGTLTGFGGSIGIIDDPIKNHKEAFNERVLNEQYEWYVDTFLSRIEEGGIQILVMTRWSTRDLCGRLLATEPDDWYVVNMPAYDPTSGQMLCEEVLSRKSYLKKKARMTPAIFDANFDGVPVDIEGRLYSAFKTYKDVPKDADGRTKFEQVIAYVDTADTGADYLCAIVAGVYEGEGWVLDVLYTDAPMEETEPATAKLLCKRAANVAHIESNNGGRGFARTVERLLWETHNTRGVSIEWFHQSGNKQARILAGATFVSQHLYYPEDWESRWPEYARDMMVYQRKGKNDHDDAPDATTGLAEKIQAGNPNGEFDLW